VILHHQNGFFGHKFHRPVNIDKLFYSSFNRINQASQAGTTAQPIREFRFTHPLLWPIINSIPYNKSPSTK
ncbi:MAG: hypothetical protein Q8L00_00795, partial [Deltaproteobacteria bacterium]|nr:hypothetical protein [Deltaproteobacteria bacterium]